MRRLHELIVLQEELDGLGHMNARFYGERAAQAHGLFMDELGLPANELAARGAKLSPIDTYTRFHREQFAGAPLTVRGGVLDVMATSLRLFYEVLNADKAESAATHITEYALIDAATRTPLLLPAAFAGRAWDEMIDAPEHGAPRSLTLAPPRVDLAFADILARLSDQVTPNLMNQRREWIVEAAECDAFGYLRDDRDGMFNARMAGPAPPAAAPMGAFRGPVPFASSDGRRLGWALLETRNVRLAQPRAGDTLELIGGEIALGAKTRHSRRWTFNRSTGVFASINDTVGIALDLDARRAAEIPNDLREALAASYVPEFA